MYGFFDVANVRKKTLEDLDADGLSKGQNEETFEFIYLIIVTIGGDF